MPQRLWKARAASYRQRHASTIWDASKIHKKDPFCWPVDGETSSLSSSSSSPASAINRCRDAVVAVAAEFIRVLSWPTPMPPPPATAATGAVTVPAAAASAAAPRAMSGGGQEKGVDSFIYYSLCFSSFFTQE